MTPDRTTAPEQERDEIPTPREIVTAREAHERTRARQERRNSSRRRARTSAR